MATMITRVRIKNYRSLGSVTVDLGRLTVLVGRNGAGKSNFLDALRFVRDVLKTNLEEAVSKRGGMAALLRADQPNAADRFSMGFDLDLGDAEAHYGFTLRASKDQEFVVEREEAYIRYHDEQSLNEGFLIEDGEWQTQPVSVPNVFHPQAPVNYLLIDYIARLSRFQNNSIYRVYSILTENEIFTLPPSRLRAPQPYSHIPTMEDEGERFASALQDIHTRWEHGQRGPFSEIRAILFRLIGGVQDIRTTRTGAYVIVEIQHSNGTWIDLSQESDGTIRALALLIGLYQQARNHALVAVEEPELHLHPGTLGILADVFRETAQRRQVLLTTQSPDLIARFAADELRIVERVDGVTQIGPLSADQRSVIEDQLFSAGDLLRIESLRREGARA